MKKEQEHKQTKVQKKKAHDVQQLNIKDFAKHIKPFEWYGP